MAVCIIFFRSNQGQTGNTDSRRRVCLYDRFSPGRPAHSRGAPFWPGVPGEHGPPGAYSNGQASAPAAAVLLNLIIRCE